MIQKGSGPGPDRENKEKKNCRIRKLRISDPDLEACLLQLSDLDTQIFPESPWGLSAFRENLDHGYDSLFLAYSGKNWSDDTKGTAPSGDAGLEAAFGGTKEGAMILCGFALLRKLDVSELLLIGTAETFRGQGIGKRLLSEAISEAGKTAVLLEVRAHNAAALQLYKSCGFQEYRRRKNYYADPREDAVLMIREPQE